MSESSVAKSVRRRDRSVHIATSFDGADAWDREQQRLMTPDERRDAARELRARAFPMDAPDIRACHGR
ncbi:MAG: hypothetical protein AAGK21_01565 [Bacteroidota bacterium]